MSVRNRLPPFVLRTAALLMCLLLFAFHSAPIKTYQRDTPALYAAYTVPSSELCGEILKIEHTFYERLVVPIFGLTRKTGKTDVAA